MLIPRGLLADPAGVLRRGTRSGLPGFPEPLPSATEVDVLVVGSGVAGLSAALAVPPGRTVLLAAGELARTREGGHSRSRVVHAGGDATGAELAARREESRGGHWRSDHPAPVEAWRVRQTLTRPAAGELEAGLLAVPEAAVEARR